MDAPRLVFDTNVLLDLWLFDDPTAQPLRLALEGGLVQALRSASCDAEFAEVVARDRFGLDASGRERLLARWMACSEPIDGVLPAPLVCADPDDQKFLDAAFSARATALLTRDKALLQLASRAAVAGLAICTPAAALGRGELSGLVA